MKKYLAITLLALLGALGAQAKSGDISVAGQFGFASHHSLFALGTQVQIEPVNNFRFAPEFLYYFKNNGVSAYNVNVNLHYTIRTSTAFAVYPLAGFSFAHFKYDQSHWDWGYKSGEDCYGANIGCGAEYRIQENLSFYSEQRFQIMEDHNQSVTVLGIKYTF